MNTEEEKAYELKLALTMLIRVFEKTKKTKEQQKYFDGAKEMLAKHFDASDILRAAAQQVEGEVRKYDNY